MIGCCEHLISLSDIWSIATLWTGQSLIQTLSSVWTLETGTRMDLEDYFIYQLKALLFPTFELNFRCASQL